MGFWGIEVKPGKKVSPYDAANALGKLRITQATLGLGSSNERSILQCFGGQKSPIFLCTLLPDKIESCSLDLEFDEDDSVTFSVVGKRSIHLSGYFLEEDDSGEDAYGFDHLVEDIPGTESEDSSNYDSEEAFEDVASDDDTFGDDGHFDIASNRGLIIEEIIDEDKDDTGKSQLNQKKNKQSNCAENPKAGQIVPWNNASPSALESEDEDGFPILKSGSQKKHEVAPEQSNSEITEKSEKKNKRSVKTIEQDDEPDRQKKRKKLKNDKEGKNDKEASVHGTDAAMEDQKKVKEVVNGDADQLLSQDPPNVKNENQPEKKRNKKKNKKLQEIGDPSDTTKIINGDADQHLSQDPPTDKNENQPEKKKKKKKNKKLQETADLSDTAKVEQSASTLSEQKPSQVRTFPNGLVVEELEMGKPDGKKASPGKQVSVHYIGKLQKNGKIFDSNVGRAPFKFRLGIGQVIKGWDVGVNGMRIGDKRRLTIPPPMGYGARGAGGKIPPNSWLVFDVELVDVR
ncbi:hypothetical protein SAY87_000500 [Trapa incisa]|uniref:peptidylprolyl isomerase n=1 Tax=Trapa incisa TaxID=236973 RepID=A0AAN7GRQ2_9MYRT|nr:hypothetical protein SAY87_000500 [Trapa incisa]